ncbi:MAG: class I SAM-dependent methyltransferase [Solirubrobacteraceae bacterium]|nr:class I SAM-dependent methyltransferase [Solirubrobacteraceae bacterium]
MVDTAEQHPATWWEERYASGGITWSGNPNDLLVGEVEGLVPGLALDLGCGTGGDALWLAARGWQVTAVDLAQAALTQAAEHAASAGVAGLITWEQHDFDVSFPAGEFDLVSACYLQSPFAFQRLETLRKAADAVAPGGTLVVVSHESFPSGGDPHPEQYMPTAPQLLSDLALPDGAWETVRAEGLDRSKTKPDGTVVNYRDNVLHLRRR